MESIQQLTKNAKDWLSHQDEPEHGSAIWYAHNNLRFFISALESDSSSIGIQRSVHALRHHIVDQFEWSAEYCKAISGFCEAADRIRRTMANNSFKPNQLRGSA
jgi:hypothetical protein